MTPHTFKIYERIRASGGSIVAIADHQRAEVSSEYEAELHGADLHDVTIKNGIQLSGAVELNPRVHQRGEPIHVGTLSRVHNTDIKGIVLASRVVDQVNVYHDAFLTIAGPLTFEPGYDVLLPVSGENVTYVGRKKGDDKIRYLDSLHVGAAFSNPGKWNENMQQFDGWFCEGNSLALGEMISRGLIPVSTDSGGAEAMRDAGLSEYIIPLDMIQNEGMDPFIIFAAQKIIDAAHDPLDRVALSRRARTMDDVGKEYAVYIMDKLHKGT